MREAAAKAPTLEYGLALAEGESLTGLRNSSSSQRVMDRRFEQSLRVVKDALARRAAWKRDREAAKEPG